MHELAIAESIVDVASAHAAGRRVTAVEVKVGHLRQVVPSALRFNFELVAAGTALEGAELRLEEVPVEVRCCACGETSEQDWFPLACGKCGGLDVDVIAGEELCVEALELEDRPEDATELAGAAKGGTANGE